MPDGGKRALCAGGLEHTVYRRQDKGGGDGEREAGLHTHTPTHTGAHTHTRILTHKPCKRANEGRPEILVLGTHMYPLTGKRALRRRDGIKGLDVGA